MRLASFEACLFLTPVTELNRVLPLWGCKSIGRMSACQLTTDYYYRGRCSKTQEPTFLDRVQPLSTGIISLEFRLFHLYTANIAWVDCCNSPMRLLVPFEAHPRELPELLTPFADSNCVHTLTEIFTPAIMFL